MVKGMTQQPDLELLRFPVGRFAKPASYDLSAREASIEVLRLLPERLAAAVADLNIEQLDTPYRDGGWTLRQVVHHVADSHMNAYVRMKLALTEEWPTIKPYDEAAWAELPDSSLPLHISLDLLEALHTRWVTMLESMSAEDFRRGYVHPAGGHQELDLVLALYDWHSRHHTAHVTGLRARMGW